MKHKFKKLAVLFALVFGLVACSTPVKQESTDVKQETPSEEVNKETASEEKKVVTASSSFIYDMVYQIAGDKVKINIIVPAGQDPHTYVAKPEDIAKIDEADLLLYHGLHFEAQMVDALASGVKVSKNFDEKDLIGEDHASIDPHFWFDLDLYKSAISVVAQELGNLIPEEKENFDANLEAYKKELDNLDAYIKEQVALIPEDSRWLITPHDAFTYFSREYGINVHAPQGISTETEVSGQDITETVNVIVDHKVKAIFAESTTDPARMEKLKEVVKSKGFEVNVVSGEGNELYSDSLDPLGQPLDTFIAMVKHDVDLIVENLK